MVRGRGGKFGGKWEEGCEDAGFPVDESSVDVEAEDFEVLGIENHNARCLNIGLRVGIGPSFVCTVEMPERSCQRKGVKSRLSRDYDKLQMWIR